MQIAVERSALLLTTPKAWFVQKRHSAYHFRLFPAVSQHSWRRHALVLTSLISRSPARAGNAAGMLAILLWSSTVGLIRSISEALGPVGGSAMIFTVSGLLAVLFTGIPAIRGMDRKYLLLSGLIFVGYEISLALCLGYAHGRGQAMELGMINYLWPSLTMLFAVLLRQQSASIMVLAPGITLAFLGIVWVMKGNDAISAARLAANLADNPPAYALAFLAALLWPAYSVLARKYGNGKGAVGLYLLATAAVLWIYYLLSDQPAMQVNVHSVAEVLVLGTFTAASYSAWNFGIQKGSIGLLAILSYFTPILSSWLASAWLGVAPPMAFWIGVAMVAAGSLMSWWATRLPERQ
ncbi:MAG TPA: aromatic amino acid DMT transporter YddG [Noviherbaspirillum sp.]|uniref:aromatic amino acid DMT transporter YddG n=1 Tax=Noviherbaspirillum sp. TaxID=1926288 RepID=UPI002B46CB30|nr:aromatic amino acid DMT transporter YddG [Noviherbaspirillum sp.]HJV84062.1 aromatic amino acid DMT transporter YddG [Noviherbaspirillum sp.]